MTEISAQIRLRPTRIGFITRATDLTSVRAIMRACACVWGGMYNPIIPVLRSYPKEWRPTVHEQTKPRAVALGYVKFFEPDVYVEAVEGLADEAGLKALRREHGIYPPIITLKDFLTTHDGRTWAEVAYGLSIQDVLFHIHKTEQQFVHRDPRENLLVTPQEDNGLVESMFGAYPDVPSTKYFRKNFEDVFNVQQQEANPDLWFKAFIEGANTPLTVTRKDLDRRRYWYHHLVIFVFDPEKAIDLIDLWNMRLEPHPIVPVPIEWFATLADPIFDLLESEHRPIVGNPQGLMHNATVEFARSISKQRAEQAINNLRPGLPEGALAIKNWRNRIWLEDRSEYGRQESRMKITAEEKHVELTVKEDRQLSVGFETLAPNFASRYGQGDHRWVNMLTFASYNRATISSLLPFNTFDRAWPHVGLGHTPVSVGGEGWVFPQQYEGHTQYVTLLTANEAISGYLEQLGIHATLSEPGHIAKQMLEHVGGLWGTHLLADLETLQLLNKMAGGIRKHKNSEETVEEHFELRTAPLKDWTDLIARRKENQSLPAVTLENFTKANIIRLGLETACPHCNARNWNTLASVDYRITCDRCLKPYDFPQANLRDHNKNWTYRVVGPFSVPDYGRGSYSAILALNVIDRFNMSMNRITFSTAMTLKFDGVDTEVDFLAWRGEERMESNRSPKLILGEAKSLGKGNLVTPRDIQKLKTVASKLPDSVIAISVLRDHFTPEEKRLLKKFVIWGRRLNSFGEPTNPVLLLTSNELLMDHHVSSSWKKLGGNHSKFTDYNQTGTLRAFADATQQIYLGMESFSRWRDLQWKKRHERNRPVQASTPHG